MRNANSINKHLHTRLFQTALLTGCLFAGGCENDVNVVKQLGKGVPGVEEGKNIVSYMSTNGKLRAKLTAPVLLRFQGDSARKSEFPNSLHVDFYNDSLKLQSQLDARYGRYLENENKVFLRDHVVAFNVKGDTLFCDELYWDQSKEQFYTDKKVTISQTSPRQRVVGLNGMVCNQDLSSWTLYKMQPGSYFVIPDSTAVQ